MAIQTSNIGLIKDDENEFYNVGRINDNLDLIDQAIGNKVEKIDGKGLSTEDYTTDEKVKLQGIEANANNYVHPTTAGNKHIPSGGTVGQVLKNTASGTASWQDDSAYIHPTTHPAEMIQVADTGNYYTGTTAEAALQEVGGALENIAQQTADTTTTFLTNLPIKAMPAGIVDSPVSNMVIKGKTITNLLGTVGDCESTSGWTTTNASISLDVDNKVFGSNSIKITTTSISGLLYRTLGGIVLSNSRYYLISAYLKNGNAQTGLRLVKDSAAVGSTAVISTYVSNNVNFQRVGIKIDPSKLIVDCNLVVYCDGTTTGLYGFIDGIQVNEISEDDYNLTEAQLLEKYPYVNNTKSIEGLKIRSVKKNFIKTKEITLKNTVYHAPIVEEIKVPKNTIMTISATFSDGTARLNVRPVNELSDANAICQINQTAPNATFNTGSYNTIYINYTNDVAGDTPKISNIQLEIGAVVTEYEPKEESIIELPYTLRSLPDGTCDEIDLSARTYIQRLDASLAKLEPIVTTDYNNTLIAYEGGHILLTSATDVIPETSMTLATGGEARNKNVVNAIEDSKGRADNILTVLGEEFYPTLKSSATFSANGYCIASDNDHIYVGHHSGTVRKYNKETLAYVGATPGYGGAIRTIHVDDNYIYAGGSVTNAVKKYSKSTLTLISTAETFCDIFSIVGDSSYIYVCGAMINAPVKKYYKSNLQLVSTSSDVVPNGISCLAIDDTYVYAGAFNNKYVKRYNKATLSYISQVAYSGDICAIAIYDNDLYVGGEYTGGMVQLYRDFTFLNSMAIEEMYGAYSLHVDEYNVYVGGYNEIYKLKRNLEYNGIKSMKLGRLNGLVADDDYIYSTGDSQKIDVRGKGQYLLLGGKKYGISLY